MPSITVSVLNRSDQSIVTDGELATFAKRALQAQVSKHLAPNWRIDAMVKFVQQPEPGSWWLLILNTTDQGKWLGYHLTDEGLPLAKVFVKTIAQYGLQWTVSASHELLEMLADPYCNRMVSEPPYDPKNMPTEGQKGACFYTFEVCDPCASDSDGYRIDGYAVSDFVLPSWFESETDPSKYTDFNGKIQGPFNLSKGGYVGIYSREKKKYPEGWHLEKKGHLSPYRDLLWRERAGRTWLRVVPRTDWRRVPLSDLS